MSNSQENITTNNISEKKLVGYRRAGTGKGLIQQYGSNNTSEYDRISETIPSKTASRKRFSRGS